ncbi:hypothetical protein ACIRQO_34530 [Streptomyces anulatus]
MDTVHTTAALLPDPAELRVFLRALAVLDQAICRDPQFSRYSFSTTWGPGTEAALMDNGSGDDFSVLFTPAGVLVRGFDHESEMSPYGTDDEQVWPGVIDEVPATLRPLLDHPAFVDEGLGAPRVTACLWWETGGSAWRTGSGIVFPSGSPDPDGSGHLFRLLTDRSPEAVQAHFEEDYGRPVPLDTVGHVLAGHPLTPEAACGLNPDALSDEALLRRIAADPEAEAYLACDGEFDLTRTDPIESIALPAGLPVEPVAGCNAGGTHYLCGPAGSDRVRPVLYTDSDGQGVAGIASCQSEQALVHGCGRRRFDRGCGLAALFAARVRAVQREGEDGDCRGGDRAASSDGPPAVTAGEAGGGNSHDTPQR